MKKTFLILCALFAVLTCSAQAFFSYSEFNKHLDDWNAMNDVSNKVAKISQVIWKNEKFADKDGTLCYKIVCDYLTDSISRGHYVGWISSFFNKQGNILTQEANFNDSIIVIKGDCSLGIIHSQFNGLTIKHSQQIYENYQAWANFVIEFKSNRMRIIVRVPNYRNSFVVKGTDPLPDFYENYKKVIDCTLYEKPKHLNDIYYKVHLNTMKKVKELLDYSRSRYQDYLKEQAQEQERQSDDW